MLVDSCRAPLSGVQPGEAPELVVSLNFASVARAGGVKDFADNLLAAMVPVVGARLTVVRPSAVSTRLGQTAMRYFGELLLELRYWRRPAVALFPNYFIIPLPFSRLRRVVVVHDLQFKHYPQYTHWLKRIVLDLSYRCARRSANGLVFISDATRADFLQFYGPPRRHAVIYNPITAPAKSVRPAIQTAPYVVANFHYYPHKNLTRLLAVHQALRASWPELRLVLTGHKPANLEAMIGGNAASRGIEHVGFVSKAAVIQLVQGAEFFMSLSQFEGFNMSAAEAALANKPLVLSDIPAHREIFGDIAMLIDPQSAEIPVTRILAYLQNRRANSNVVWNNAVRVQPGAVAQQYVDFMQQNWPANAPR